MTREPISNNNGQLWHSLESIHDNNYDLSKSMIKRFPGNKLFMGNHLEIVCLFQAVEIQRLSNVLQQFYVKCKQVGKMPLDRQSYEIQIKQLTDLINLQKYQLNNHNGQLDQFKTETQTILNNLTMRYQKALQTIDSLYNDNTKLQDKINDLNLQNSRLETSKQLMSQSLRQFHHLTNEKSHIEIQLKRIQDSLVIVSRQKQSFRDINFELSERLSHMEEINRTNIQYQNKLALISQEIQRLNRLLKQKNQEKKHNQNYIRQLNQKIQSSQIHLAQITNAFNIQRNQSSTSKQQLQQLMSRNKQYQSLVKQLQNKLNIIQKLQQTKKYQINHIEIQKQNLVNNHIKQITHLQSIISQNQTNLQTLHNQNLNLKQNYQKIINTINHQNQQIKLNFQINQNQIKHLQQQIQLLVNQKIYLNQQIRISKAQNQNLKSKHQQIQNVLKREIQSIRYQQNKLNQSIFILNSEKQNSNRHLGQAQNYIQTIQNQCDSLSQQLKNRVNSSNLLTQKLNQIQHKNILLETENKLINQNYTNLCHQIENLKVSNRNLQQNLSIKQENIKQIKYQLNIKQNQIILLNQRINIQRRIIQKLQNSQQSVKYPNQKFEKIQRIIIQKNGEIINLKKQLQLSKEKIQLLCLQISKMIRLVQNLDNKQQMRFQQQKTILKEIRQEISKLRIQNSQGMMFLKKNVEFVNPNNNKYNQQNYQQLMSQYKKIQYQNQLIVNEQKLIQQRYNLNKSQNLTLQKEIFSLKNSNKNLQNYYKDQIEKANLIINQLKTLLQNKNKKYFINTQNQQQLTELKNKIIYLQSELIKCSDHKEALIKKIKLNEQLSHQNQKQLETRNIQFQKDLKQSQQQKFQLLKKIKFIEQQIEKKQLTTNQLSLQLKAQREHTYQFIQGVIQNKNKIEQENNYLKQVIKNNQNKVYNQQLKDYQKINLKNNHIVKLQTELQLAKSKIDLLCLQISKLINLIQNLGNQQQNRFLQSKNILNQICGEISKFRQQNSQNLLIYTNQCKQLMMPIHQLLQSQTVLSEKNLQYFIQKIQILQTQNNQLKKQFFSLKSLYQSSKVQLSDTKNILKRKQLKLKQLEKQLQQNQQQSLKSIKQNSHSIMIKKYNKQIEKRLTKLQNDVKNGKYKKNSDTQDYQKFDNDFKYYEQIISTIKSQNLSLKTNNYDMGLQLKQAQRLLHRVKILNCEIDRLQQKNIDLNQQVTTYHLFIGQQSTLEQKINQHLMIFPLIFCQIESLRQRVHQQQKIIAQLTSYKNLIN